MVYVKKLVAALLALCLIVGCLPLTAYAEKNEELQSNDGNAAVAMPMHAVSNRLAAPTVKVSNVTSSGKIKLSWNKVDGAVKYQVYRATTQNGTYKRLSTVTGTSLTNTSITAGSKYYYYVIAVGEDNVKSGKSNIVSRVCDLPRPVVKISVVASTGKLKLSWEKVEGASKYEVYRSSDGENYKLLKTTTGSSLTNTSVSVGNQYYYKVKAIHSNSNANSAFSAVKSGTCDLARPVVSVKLSSGKPKLSWDEVTKASKYSIYRATVKNGEYVKIGTSTGTTYTDKKVESGKTYYYKVKAIYSANTAANSAYSSVVKITVKSTESKFISYPETVSRNELATVEFQGKPNTEYTITVYYKSGASTAEGLEPKISDASGYVSWTWKVGGRTSPGTFRIVVAGGGESKTVYFTVVE